MNGCSMSVSCSRWTLPGYLSKRRLVQISVLFVRGKVSCIYIEMSSSEMCHSLSDKDFIDLDFFWNPSDSQCVNVSTVYDVVCDEMNTEFDLPNGLQMVRWMVSDTFINHCVSIARDDLCLRCIRCRMFKICDVGEFPQV